MQAMCNSGHRYRIECIPGKMPNSLSYSGEGCSLSCPPLEKDDHYYLQTRIIIIIIIIIIIRNKSSGIQLFEDKRTKTGDDASFPCTNSFLLRLCRS